MRRLRVRQFDRGRMKDRNCVRAFRTHYVGIGGFMQATACCHIANIYPFVIESRKGVELSALFTESISVKFNVQIYFSFFIE